MEVETKGKGDKGEGRQRGRETKEKGRRGKGRRRKGRLNFNDSGIPSGNNPIQ